LQCLNLIQDVESGRVKFNWDACTTQPIPYKVATLSAIDRLKIE
jgi:hypothetical protein